MKYTSFAHFKGRVARITTLAFTSTGVLACLPLHSLWPQLNRPLIHYPLRLPRHLQFHWEHHCFNVPVDMLYQAIRLNVHTKAKNPEVMAAYGMLFASANRFSTFAIGRETSQFFHSLGAPRRRIPWGSAYLLWWQSWRECPYPAAVPEARAHNECEQSESSNKIKNKVRLSWAQSGVVERYIDCGFARVSGMAELAELTEECTDNKQKRGTRERMHATDEV